MEDFKLQPFNSFLMITKNLGHDKDVFYKYNSCERQPEFTEAIHIDLRPIPKEDSAPLPFP